MAYTVSKASIAVKVGIADYQHAKGITHRDLKPEVRPLTLDCLDETDISEHTLDEGNARLPCTD